jgi:uncharacterized protein YodC (DUF2158 family)
MLASVAVQTSGQMTPPGPRMTVAGLANQDEYGPEYVVCQWFHEDELRQGVFHEDTLVAAK